MIYIYYLFCWIWVSFFLYGPPQLNFEIAKFSSLWAFGPWLSLLIQFICYHYRYPLLYYFRKIWSTFSLSKHLPMIIFCVIRVNTTVAWNGLPWVLRIKNLWWLIRWPSYWHEMCVTYACVHVHVHVRVFYVDFSPNISNSWYRNVHLETDDGKIYGKPIAWSLVCWTSKDIPQIVFSQLNNVTGFYCWRVMWGTKKS